MKIKQRTKVENKWIVIADRTKLRVFLHRPFQLLKTLENELGRVKNHELTTDRPGMSRSKFGSPSNMHVMGPEKNPHEDAAVQFAKVIARYLEKENQSHKFDSISIAAEPKMMGRIRSELEQKLSDRVEWISKDLGHLADHEVGKMFGINLRIAR